MPLIKRTATTIALCGTALTLGACATSGDVAPNEEIARAEVVIRQAEQSGAAEHSARELSMARRKIERSKSAVDDNEPVEAARLAEEASADAELAAARSRAETAEQAAEEIRATIASLRSEAQNQ